MDIETNNLLCYLEFIFVEGARVVLYHPGRPEEKYGATYGSLASISPPFAGTPVTGVARRMVDDIRAHFIERYSERGLIFAATSGFELDGTSHVQGPHVGDYHSMLLKRSFFESGSPIVLLLDEDKLPTGFIEGRCHAVCDQEFPWGAACKDIPLALACSFRTEDSALKVLPRIKSIGFTHIESGRKTDQPRSVIASNDRFWGIRESWLRTGNAARS